MKSSIYLDTILKEIPRLLGLLDKNPNSPTFGSFDRQFWHYNVVDFSSARYQEAVLTLALLYKYNLPDNIYYKNENILNWIDGALRFWLKIQNKDGSFNEWYPNEHSFVATAFTTYAVSEALLILGKEIPSYNEVVFGLKKASDWLLSYTDFTACNQVAGSISALYNVYLLTNDIKYRDGAIKKLKQLKEMQDEEGWFPEYGGPDIGYLSLAIDYLCKYYRRSEDLDAKDMIDRALAFLVYFVHPDGTFGGEYGSRNTKYIIPSGIEYSSHWSENARKIAFVLRNSLEKRESIGPYNLDDRYLSYIGYTYLQAHMDIYEGDLATPIYEGEFSRFFRNSGLFVINNKNFYLVSNLKKGGVFRITFKNKGFSITDSGVIAKIGDDFYSSGWLRQDETFNVRDNRISVRTNMLKLSYRVMGSRELLFSRLFQLTLGRFTGLSLKVKDLLRKMLITYKTKSDIFVDRFIEVSDDFITVEDKIISPKEIEKLTVGIENPYIYIPSSRYFQIQDLYISPNIVDLRTDKIRMVRRYDVNGKEELTIKSS
ncbi:hypothetical protein H5T89_02450 [bacterium]|nr:hypothetical protein [bacterium]